MTPPAPVVTIERKRGRAFPWLIAVLVFVVAVWVRQHEQAAARAVADRASYREWETWWHREHQLADSLQRVDSVRQRAQDSIAALNEARVERAAAQQARNAELGDSIEALLTDSTRAMFDRYRARTDSIITGLRLTINSDSVSLHLATLRIIDLTAENARKDTLLAQAQKRWKDLLQEKHPSGLIHELGVWGERGLAVVGGLKLLESALHP